MSTMKIPEDEEQRNIIDKLANFVARNGPKFEDLTKSKQKDNLKFSFLFGGDHHEYYKWKVALETTQVEAQKQQVQALAALKLQNETAATPAEVPPKDDDAKKDPDYVDLAHFRALVQRAILACTKDNIQNGKNWIVANAVTDEQLKKVARFLFRRLLEEVLPFQQKLHIVYLTNDVLHHSRKKEMPKLQEALQEYILPVVGVVYNGESPENQQKIMRVLKIWDNQSFFTEEIRLKIKEPAKLYDEHLAAIDGEKAIMKREKHEAEVKVRREKEEKEKKEQEEKEAAEAALQPEQPIAVPTQPPPQPPSQQPPQQIPQPIPTIPVQNIQQQPPPQPPQQTPQAIPTLPISAPQTMQQPPLPETQNYIYNQPPPPQNFQHPQGPPPQQGQYQQYQQYGQWNPQQPPQQQPPPTTVQDPFHYFGQNYPQRPPQQQFEQRPRFPQYQQGFPPPGPRGPMHGDQGYEQGPPPDWNQPYDGPPHSYQSAPPNIQTFDYSHQSVHMDSGGGSAPISFDYEHGRAPMPETAPIIEERDPTIPLAAYYDLPAGLIVPLVKLWDCEYKSVDPKDIRLPIPQPPSERLLAAVEAFYAPPSHDRPRDSQGWEKNGLFEFYKAKIKYIKDKERKLETIERSPSPPPSRSSSPDSEGERLVTDKPRNERSPSDSPTRQKSKSRSRSRSPVRDKNRSRSKSRSRSRSRSKSRSRSPGGRKRSKSRSPSRSRTPSPKKEVQVIQRESPPPEFIGFEHKSMETKIEETNVGHQMLMRMGWGGQGLGKKESGIMDPIKQNQVRDNQDKFKGIGTPVNDPFESYRKNKSYTYSRPRDRKR